ncbi:RES family NAD+ phosphorylase [Rugamonas rubra]|uniref:RES domain-containing protein n=1 Tax=Rugamonas rubra TaxID=758825 RepID=A0A1I4KVL3_9BURK|nr:RES domain-containing protein [Rugamonas rubra]SFL82785.1 RES domain-containing protein [Rugamonas rubra]
MKLWRIARRAYALDRLCAGAARFGGRWNPPNLPAFYAGASVAICALEALAHLGSLPLPPLVLVAVELPDDVSVYRPGLVDLPLDWNAMPVSASAQAFGGNWLSRMGELCMAVPSALLPEEGNVVINPLHPDFDLVALSVVRPFSFDRRLLGPRF